MGINTWIMPAWNIAGLAENSLNSGNRTSNYIIFADGLSSANFQQISPAFSAKRGMIEASREDAVLISKTKGDIVVYTNSTNSMRYQRRSKEHKAYG
jgi:hypothetical protein